MVTSSFLPGRGGIESYLAELCLELSPRLAVMAPSARDGEPLPSDLSYATIPSPRNLLFPRPPVAIAIAETASAQGSDRILFGTPWPLLLLGPRLKRWGFRYASIVHGSELLVPAAVPLLSHRLAAALSQADVLLPVSRFTMWKIRELIEHHSLDVPEIELLRARVDLARFEPKPHVDALRARYGLAAEDRVLLFVSRLVRRKGAHRLLAALDQIRDRHPKAAAVIGGTGPQERALRRRAVDAPGAFVIGRVPESDIADLYGLAEMFVFPVADRLRGLDTEGLGVVLLEAAAAGLPVVTGRSGGTEEAVIDGRTGRVIDARNETELVAAVCELLDDPTRARALGAAGRSYVREEFAERPLPPALERWLA